MTGSAAFGDLLREYRVRAGLSQEELAEKAQLSLNAVSVLERGVRRSPHRYTISLLADALALTDPERAALETARERNRERSREIDKVGNLPSHRTSFVGRGAEIAEIVQLLGRSRLVTLTGFGGIGKTRAALEVAGALLGSAWSNVWFVDLAPVKDESFIVGKIASSIQPPLTHSAETLSALASALGDRRMLLVLDNCEHLVDGVARAVGVLLEACPRTAILATSREPLNVEGEVVHRLRALAVPADMPSRVEDAYSYSAIDLFVQRAVALDQQWVLDAKNLGTIVNIGRRLSGIPLAIELVAAQIPNLGLRTIEDRLDELFAVSLGRRDLPARQQTVSSTIQWSYELLSAKEQSFLCDMCVFAGGFSLEAAELVCRRELVQGQSILRELSSLVNKSLITLYQSQDGERYLMLDSVRAFGLDRLRESGELTKAFRRHAEWLALIADRIEDGWFAEPTGAIAGILPEVDNVRAAIVWALNAAEPTDRSLAGRILTGFFTLWRVTGRIREHREWVEAALERIDEAQYTAMIAQLLLQLILLTYAEAEVLKTIDRAITLFDRVGDQRATASLHVVLTDVLARHGKLEEAERSSKIANTLIGEENMRESPLFAALLMTRTSLRVRQGRFDDARADIATAEALTLSLGRQSLAAHCSVERALVEYRCGNVREALVLVEKLTGTEPASMAFLAGQAIELATNFQLQLGELDRAAASISRLFDRLLRDVVRDHPCRYAATLAALRGDPLTAAKLLGYARAHEPRGETIVSQFRQPTRKLLDASLREQLDNEAIAIAEAEGARWTEECAFAEALCFLNSEW